MCVPQFHIIVKFQNARKAIASNIIFRPEENYTWFKFSTARMDIMYINIHVVYIKVQTVKYGEFVYRGANSGAFSKKTDLGPFLFVRSRSSFGRWLVACNITSTNKQPRVERRARGMMFEKRMVLPSIPYQLSSCPVVAVTLSWCIVARRKIKSNSSKQTNEDHPHD